MFLHFSSVNCLRTSPTICPTLCSAFRSFSDLSNCFVKSLSCSLTVRNNLFISEFLAESGCKDLT